MKILFIYLSAAYFLLAGIGYNVAAYCCQNCAHEGVISMSKCNQIHEESFGGGDCCDHEGESSCNELQNSIPCHFFRFAVDTPSVENFSLLSSLVVNYVYLLHSSTFLSLHLPEIELPNSLLPSKFSFPTTGRSICALHAVFII